MNEVWMLFHTKHGPKLIIASDNKVHYAIAEGLILLYKETGLGANSVEITPGDYRKLSTEFMEAKIFETAFVFPEKCLMKIHGPAGTTAVECFMDESSLETPHT